jgi:hypothetical protein
VISNHIPSGSSQIPKKNISSMQGTGTVSMELFPDMEKFYNKGKYLENAECRISNNEC